VAELTGQVFAGYEIIAKLGQGGMGAVYKARQPKLDRLVALKVLSSELAADPDYVARFKRDATAVAGISHPNIVQIHSVGEHAGAHYVATEFVEGELLCKRLERRGRLDARESLAIVFYAARALSYGWSKLKLAHLDIRPENIFVLANGDVKLNDLGIAKPPAGSRTGLPHYTAPEQAAAGEVDFRADIYSLGCVLHHMLTGKTPYEGSDAKTLLAKHAGDPPRSVTKTLPACPASLERWLGKMMAKQPGNRHQSYDDLIKELLEVRDEVKRATQPRATVQTNTESRQFAGYTFLAKLGRNDMGVDYEALETTTRRIVALKVLTQRFSRDADFVERFKREMAAVIRLSHDNIVRVYAAGEADGACYIASEFVEGRTLRQRLERRGQLQPREALAIAFYAAQALQHAWTTTGLAHRAVTPDNIILTNDRTVKIGDFGLAKIMEAEPGAADQNIPAVGSPHYMSPEQARGVKELDCRADIYSLGCLLYHMLTGQTPYSGDNPTTIQAKHNSNPPPAILKAWPSCPASLAKLMDRMLAKSRRDRPQDYEELLAEIVKIREEFKRVKVVSPPLPEKAAATPTADEDEPDEDETEAEPAARNWKPLFVSAGIAAVVLLGGLLVWAPWKKPPVQSLPQEVRRTEYSSSRVTPLAQTAPPHREVARATTKPGTTTYAPPASMSKPPAPKPRTEPAALPKPLPRPTAPADTKASNTPSPADNQMAPHTTLAKAGNREIVLDVPSGAATNAKPMTDEAFADAVASLPPQEQVRRVAARLQELNPGFDGKASYKIENGAVTELSISTTGTLVPTVGVSDLVPLKTLKRLKRLVLAPAKPNEQGALTDLSALSGMALTWLACHGNPQLHDLSPLKDMPLTSLSCGGTQVKDLTPLSGMRLTTLSINDTPIEDISALAGIPLAVLWCNNTMIAGLSPLKGMPLRELHCDFVLARDGPVLRGIPTLAKINDVPVAAFWKRAEVATMVPATIGRVVKKAADFKPLFDGKVMTGWKPRSLSRPNGWRVRRSSMINTPPSDDLATKDAFGNFEFYCEYQIARHGRSGVLLRGLYRIPMLDDMGMAPSKTCSGSVSELLAPTKNTSKTADTWQALYVKFVGDIVTVILNGKKVIDARRLHESSGSVADEEVKAGPIVLLGTGGGVTFRNLRIKELSAD